MNRTFKKIVSFVLSAVMVLTVFSVVPFSAFAANDYTINSTTSTDGYYNLISKKDWDTAPGISESEIVLNNDDGTRRQVIHVMEADLNNEYTKVIGSYAEMNTSKYQTSTMDVQAAWVEDNWNLNVVGGMNTCLSWYSGYPAEKVGMPLGFLMVDGEVLWDGCEGFPTVIVINKDFDAEGNARPADIPKVEMVQIKSSADLDGWEDQVIPCSSGYIVKDGKNVQTSANHSDAAPRSVVGIKADGTVVIMENDGRQSPFSIGMSMYELAEVMLDLGCVYAANCDGGGSSTFLAQRPGEDLEVVNSPSDGGLRPTTQGILFISTAPSDGTFCRASVETTTGEYYTPYSQVQFTAIGSDLSGAFAEIPAEAVWQLSDDSMGTIDQNGLFVSTGKSGSVSAQIAYNGKVVGESTINIVVPDKISFSQATLTVPNGQTTSFGISAFYGVYDVATRSDDFIIKLSSDEMGVLNGYELTATEDSSVKGGTITATLAYDSTVTATMEVVYGKASEVVYDFENGFGDDWYVEQLQKRKNWSKTEKTSHYNILVDHEAVTAETGMVHDGNGAAAVYSDNTYATLNWAGAAIYWANETVTYENVSSIGAWVYIPKDAVSFGVRFLLAGVKDGNQSSIDVTPHNFGDSLYFEESGWRYVSVDVSDYDAIILNKAPTFAEVNNNNRYSGFRIELTCQLNGGSSGEYNWSTTPGVKSVNTFYIDNLTIDYSSACDDREAPNFGEVVYVEPITTEDKYLNNQRNETSVTTYNNIGFSVAVSENTERVNATGLDADTAKAYIDGNEVDCDFNGNKLSVASTELTNGVHTIKFTICDNAGNYSSVIRKINVQGTGSDATVKVVPKSNTNLVFTGSQYWVDIVSTAVENVDEITVALDLNNVNEWIPERIETLYGFTASYSTDIARENILYLTIKRTGDVEATGENVIASIPVQTWEWKEEDYPGYLPSAGGDNDLNGNSMYDPYECWQEYVTTNMDVIVNPIAGKVVNVDGSDEWFSGEKIQVDTEQMIGTWWGCSAANKVYFADKSSWHLHVAGEPQSKEATCTEAGYTNRIFCVGCACVTEEKLGHVCDSANGCDAVLDWGTTVAALGHEWAVNADGKLACVNGGELFSGEYTDGKTYVNGVVVADGWNADNTAYYVDGVKVTGTVVIDKVVYTFDDNGVYQPSAMFEGFIESEDGLMYFYSNNNYEKAYAYINDTAYYFADGIAFDGNYTINGETCLFEGGKYVSCSTADVVDAGYMGEKVNYIIYADGSMVLGGEGATYKYTSRANLPWYKLNKDIRSIVIGKDITALNQFALADIYYAKTITFEEGSKLTYIGPGAVLSCYGITEITFPDSLETIAQNAFKMCKNLVNVYLPYNIKSINKLAFVNNQNVVMEKIHLHVFEGTVAETYAKNYNIPYTYRKFVDKVVASGTCGANATWTFYQSGKMVIGGSGAMDNYTSKDATPWASYLLDIKEIEIGKDVTKVGNFAFAYAHNVKSVTFEEGSKLEYVGAASFMYMLYTTEVVLPATVTTIGNNAFSYGARLESIIVPQNVSLIYVRSFYKCPNLVINVTEGTYGESYAKSNNVPYVTRAFVDTVLATGTCGESATWTLYDSGRMVIGGSGAMDNYTSKDATPWAAYLLKIKTIEIGKDITKVGNFAFAYAHNVKSVTFEEGSKLEYVGAAAFMYMLYTTEVVLPETVTTIGNNAFSYCSALKSVVVPQSVKLIYARSFYKCPSLVLAVASGSYAESFAAKNGIAYEVK